MSQYDSEWPGEFLPGLLRKNTSVIQSENFSDGKLLIWTKRTNDPILFGVSGDRIAMTIAGNGSIGVKKTPSEALFDVSGNIASTGNINHGSVVNKVTVFIASGGYSVDANDYTVVINKTTGAATTVTLPSSPVTGRTLCIIDGKGDALLNNITVTPASGTINGASTYVISSNRGTANLVYNGTEWNVF
jgi:hypothetical protein